MVELRVAERRVRTAYEVRKEAAAARALLVTGYEEHRASLSERKRDRRAVKIDLKLPLAGTAFHELPRRKQFDRNEEKKS